MKIEGSLTLDQQTKHDLFLLGSIGYIVYIGNSIILSFSKSCGKSLYCEEVIWCPSYKELRFIQINRKSFNQSQVCSPLSFMYMGPTCDWIATVYKKGTELQ